MERKLGVRSNEFQAPAELRFSGIFAVFVYEMDRMGPVIQGVAHHEFVTDISRQIPANSQMMGIKTIIEYTGLLRGRAVGGWAGRPAERLLRHRLPCAGAAFGSGGGAGAAGCRVSAR